MKKQTLYRIAMSVFFLLVGELSASARSPENLMTVQIPFDFQVDEKPLPAGAYVIQRDPQTPQILIIECPERNIRVIVRAMPHSLSEQPARTILIFKEYGEKRFLSEVKVLERGVGYALVKSKTERRLAQTVAARLIRATSADGSSRAQPND